MPPKFKLYIDLDGTLTDFDESCRRWFEDMEPEETVKEYKDRVGGNQFWRNIRRTNGRFWSEMKPLDPHIVHVFDQLRTRCPHIAILSSPDERDPMCIKSKGEWLDRWLGGHFTRLFHKNKYEYACPNSILIDDMMHQTESWKAAGGKAILFKGKYDAEFWEELDRLLQS
jgi:hypothetical protein